MPDTNPTKPTAGAMRALGLAQLVNKVFAGERVKSKTEGHPGYRVEMAPPEGTSTTRAAKPQERLMLVPVEARAGEVNLLFGTADPALTEATLHSYDRLRADFSTRFEGELSVDADDYARVLKKLQDFFDHQGVPVTIAAPGAVSAAPAAKRPSKRSLAIMVITVLVVLLALATIAVRMK